ncbi:hypothetical protein B0T22DRAFT_231437 [Podospora appendiculata]|uniref:Uncharacterized protein n=1 Tax=Podospora appendiculata TaxID=314037 RepID=A0AAE0X604_9PEZI|nr:hypothetical protein B0T22DRAFT_231437 [Podospora appendiculata]
MLCQASSGALTSLMWIRRRGSPWHVSSASATWQKLRSVHRKNKNRSPQGHVSRIPVSLINTLAEPHCVVSLCRVVVMTASSMALVFPPPPPRNKTVYRRSTSPGVVRPAKRIGAWGLETILGRLSHVVPSYSAVRESKEVATSATSRLTQSKYTHNADG